MSKGEHIKLSICMIVKNEEANLKRCLDSILPLVHEPWCELVVLDTGSADRSVEVAQAYTGKVFERDFTPWSFSDARNECASHAAGERIMVIDADEVLLSDSLYALEDLILNPEYADQKTIFFNIRSYSTADLQQYTEMLQPRVFARTDKPVYSGAAHNKPRCETPYCYAMTVIVGHYGYLWANDPELLQKKYDRTLPMLLEEYEADPHSVHAISHLVKTYFLTHENDKLIEFGERYITEMRKQDYHEGWTAYLEPFTKLLYVYCIVNKDEQNALRVYRETLRYTTDIMAFPYLMGKLYAMKEPPDRRNAAYYFEECIRIASEEKPAHAMLMNNNDRQIIPEALNFLACWEFANGGYERAGELAREGIRLTPAGMPIRWDIWNEDQCAVMLKPKPEYEAVEA